MRKAIKERYFDLTALHDMFDKCTIVLERKPDDDTLRRYMMFYDLVEMTYELLKNSTPKVQHADLDTFIEHLNKVWDSKVSGDDLRVQILKGVNTLFPQGNAAPAPAPAPKDDLYEGGGQTERFCSCVKKVKKTLKARPGSTKEQGSIAICTKSVLQTKGRTLRKVRCRDKVLETQPMKPQEGGKFWKSGADTPVFNNEVVGEWNGFPIIHKDAKKDAGWLDKQIKTFNPVVVRMVSAGDGEIAIHRALKDAFNQKVPIFDEFVKMHINLWAGGGMYRVDYAETLKMVTEQDKKDNAKMAERLANINARFSEGTKGTLKWYGLVTRTQARDVYDLDLSKKISALCTILRVLLHIDGRIIHFDLHSRNMAVMLDGTPVIHDVGRMKIRDAMDTFAPFEIGYPIKLNKRVLRNALKGIFWWPNYNIEYRQYYYIARLFKDLRKSWGEKFMPPTEDKKWEHTDELIDDPEGKKKLESSVKFEDWLNTESEVPIDDLKRDKCSVRWVRHIQQNGAALMDLYDKDGRVITDTSAITDFVYLKPKFETRYHQIARVFDILSVLSALSATWKESELEKRIAYYYARKTAVKICDLLKAEKPGATQQEVGKVVRAFLNTTGTQTECGGNNTDSEREYAVNKKAARAAAADDAKLAELKAAADAASAKAKNVREEVEKAEAALQAARQAAASSPDVVVDDVGELDKAVIAELDVEVPNQMLLDEAVVDASEILRESTNEDNSAKLIDKGLLLSVKDVIDEASVLVDAPTDLPKVKRLKDPILFEEAKLESEADAKDEAQPVEGAAEAQAAPAPSPPTGGRQEGGVLGATGESSAVFQAGEGEEPWGFLPSPVNPEDPTVQKIKETLDPRNFVAHVSIDAGLNAKHDIVKNSAYGIAGHALTYDEEYKCNLEELVRLQGDHWVRDEKTRRLQRARRDIDPQNWEAKEVIQDIASKHGDQGGVPCLIIPKFKETVSYLSIKEAILAMIAILKGLCIRRDFVINDLHMGNMAVMPDNRAVTFDYDKLVMFNEFKGLFVDILANPFNYINLVQFEHVMKLGPAKVQKYVNSRPDETFFVNYDLLSVLSSLKFVCSQVGAPAATTAVDTCMQTLATLPPDDSDGRRSAVDALGLLEDAHREQGWYLADHPNPDADALRFAEKEAIAEPWRVWTEARARQERGRRARAREGLNLPSGGRRTFRRKGLPQLL
jgi:hypothetical protein